MKLKKMLTHKDQRQIWRMLISDSDKLILETRDASTKEVFYHCISLTGFEGIFYNFQLEEKCWLGIETIYNEVALFHKFPKPDLPGHKEIIALDLVSQKVLWINKELSYLFVANDKVYGFQQGFEERYFTSLDYKTGEKLEDLGTDYLLVNDLRSKSENEKDQNVYLFPRIFSPENEVAEVKNAIETQTKGLNLTGESHYLLYDDLLLFNFHVKEPEGLLTNNFVIVDLPGNSTLISEVLNYKARALYADSFFIYKELLFVLREKNEVIVYQLEKN
jgi:Domain of unknown function (DUF4905)